MTSFALTLRTLSAEDLGPSPRPQSLPQSGHSGLLDLYTREHLDVGVFAACAALIISKSLSALCILLFHYHFSPFGSLHILMSQGVSAARCFSQLQIVAISQLAKLRHRASSATHPYTYTDQYLRMLWIFKFTPSCRASY